MSCVTKWFFRFKKLNSSCKHFRTFFFFYKVDGNKDRYDAVIDVIVDYLQKENMRFIKKVEFCSFNKRG